ncbi:MAG TPA: class I SAM-dependent methyltransferase [Streptosporangiaceae bacterium]|nr:class I SAM-dependent methyltransferase [Streptosporangiaceae bacterium]
MTAANAGKDLTVPKYRDVQAFHDRARGYEGGLLGRFHAEVVARTIDLALASGHAPKRVLDVGCGTGLLLRQLAARLPDAAELTGVDAATGMIEAAGSANDRLRYLQGKAERLPFENASFDLLISTTSFDHWADQPAGLAECHRVLAPGGRLVLADLFSLALLPTLVVGRSDRARTRLRATKLLAAAGFRSVTWHRLHSGIIRAVTATA